MKDGPLAVDQDHATDLAAPKGMPAPARGWIVDMELRDGSVWGRVEWTEDGARMVAAREYRGVSPVFLHTKRGKKIVRIVRASLVNTPNLRGLAALHSEGRTMDFMKRLCAALSLADDAGEDAAIAAVVKLTASLQAAQKVNGETETALQAALAPIAKAAGLAEDAKPEAVAASVATLAQAQGSDGETVRALQAELAEVTTTLNTMIESGAKDRATAFVDDAIKAGRVGVKPLRDKYIAMHAKNPSQTEEIINAMPMLGPSGAAVDPPEADGEVSLNASQSEAARLLGIPVADYRKTLERKREKEEAR